MRPGKANIVIGGKMEYVVTVSPQEVRGEMKIYSCPKSLCTHVDWALSDIFQSKIELDWKSQQIAPGAFSANLNWSGPINLSSRIVSVLSKWPKLRLEVFQDSNGKISGERYAVAPNLGIFRADINSLGETVVTESRLRAALERTRIENEPFEVELAFLLGTPWDEDLEPFRRSHNGSIVKWISKTG
jgi:hypothetical protein